MDALQVLKLGFTVGIIPSLNIAAGLIGFCGIKGIVALANLMHFRLWAKPFTRYAALPYIAAWHDRGRKPIAFI